MQGTAEIDSSIYVFDRLHAGKMCNGVDSRRRNKSCIFCRNTLFSNMMVYRYLIPLNLMYMSGIMIPEIANFSYNLVQPYTYTLIIYNYNFTSFIKSYFVIATACAVSVLKCTQPAAVLRQ